MKKIEFEINVPQGCIKNVTLKAKKVNPNFLRKMLKKNKENLLYADALIDLSLVQDNMVLSIKEYKILSSFTI